MAQLHVPGHLHDLSHIHLRNGSRRLAIQFLEDYLHRLPNAPDAEVMRANLVSALGGLVRLNTNGVNGVGRGHGPGRRPMS